MELSILNNSYGAVDDTDELSDILVDEFGFDESSVVDLRYSINDTDYEVIMTDTANAVAAEIEGALKTIENNIDLDDISYIGDFECSINIDHQRDSVELKFSFFEVNRTLKRAIIDVMDRILDESVGDDFLSW